MADFQPFQAVLYNPAVVSWPDVVTEPYDKITPEMQAAYYKRSPYNAVRVVLGRESAKDTPVANKYTRAAISFRSWLDEGALARRPFSGFYILEQEFTWEHRRVCRRGLIGRMRLSPFTDRIVRPHEKTYTGPKADRLMLLRATEGHWEPVFLLCDGRLDLADAIWRHAGPEPVADFRDASQVTHRLWEVTGPEAVRELQFQLGTAQLYIADGHHRYETAMAFRDEMRLAKRHAGPEAPFEFVMATVVDMKDPGLLLLPTHRLVRKAMDCDAATLLKKLASFFTVSRAESLDRTLEWMRAAARGEHRFGLCLASGELCLLQLRADPEATALRKTRFNQQPPLWEELDVALAHVLILEHAFGLAATADSEDTLGYHRDARDVQERVRGGEGVLGVLLNPTPVVQVKAIADAGSRMPQKSTDFYPKLPSGLVIYDIQT